MGKMVGRKVVIQGKVCEIVGRIPMEDSTGLPNPCSNAAFHPDHPGFGRFNSYWVFDSKDLELMDVLGQKKKRRND